MELMRNDKVRMDFIMTFWQKRKERTKKVLKLERYNHSRMRPL